MNRVLGATQQSLKRQNYKAFMIGVKSLGNNERYKELGDFDGKPFKSLQQLIVTQYSRGLNFEKVEDFVKIWKAIAGPEDIEWMYEVLKRAPGRPPKKTEEEEEEESHNIIRRLKQGTSLEYTLARLKRDHPELYARVVAEELSANAAAIEAGFRKKTTPLETLQRAWSKATEQERKQFLESI